MYSIAVPSYKRSLTFVGKTLRVIRESKLDERSVTVFVADEAEAATYSNVLAQVDYSGNIVVAEPGMRAVRNFIQQYYEDGNCVLNLDDDIDGFFEKVDDKLLRPVTDFDAVAREAFSYCQNLGIGLWGVYPVCNPFFMKDLPTTELRYIEGAVWGVINSRDEQVAVTLDDKEDFERSLKFYIRDGAVFRYSHISFRSNFYREPGGMQVERTPERVDASARLLAKRYPELATLNFSKKSKFTELRLKDRRKAF